MGRRIYERLYDGELWERKYRTEASNITRGLRNVCKNIAIFPVGKEDVKATEIEWLRHNPDWDKDPHPYTMHHNWIWEIATSHKLPWKEEYWESNLKIIRRAVRKTLDMNKSESSFEQHLNETLLENYSTQLMTKKKFTAYASIHIPYLLEVDAEDANRADMIAKDTPFEKWVLDPDGLQDDYKIEVVNVQPRRNLQGWLVTVLLDYCKANNLKRLSADDILHTHKNLTDDQKRWLTIYGQMWEKAQETN